MYIRQLAKSLGVSEMWLKKIKYFRTNILNRQDLEELMEIFLDKETNLSLIKAKKIEKLLQEMK